MKILAIETSCDETGAAIVSKNPKENYVKVLSSAVASSLIHHSKTGGIIPDVAAREQLRFIIPVIENALIKSNFYPPRPTSPVSELAGGRAFSKIQLQSPATYRPDIDAIAVTVCPGLIGSLLVGVETAKTLAYLWNKPVIPVNHLLGHIYANFVSEKSKIEFPAVALLVSGGHTDLLLMENHNKFKWLGGTRDDAAGEAFDKIGRLLNLPYPGGPAIEKASECGDASRFTFPRPMIGSKNFDFSFSGLKAAVMRFVILNKGTHRLVHPKVKNLRDFSSRQRRTQDDIILADIAASVQQAIVDVLVRKTINAAKQYNVKSILLGGGVACNQKLRDELLVNCLKLNVKLFAPAKSLCTDNAVMIGAYACFHPKKVPWNKITANPELYFQEKPRVI